jgi:hypothetical protein
MVVADPVFRSRAIFNGEPESLPADSLTKLRVREKKLFYFGGLGLVMLPWLETEELSSTSVTEEASKNFPQTNSTLLCLDQCQIGFFLGSSCACRGLSPVHLL